MPALQFCFDVVSPYAWLGWHELDAQHASLSLQLEAVPSFIVGGELLWGHDRLPHLAAFLRGELTIDEQLHAEILARPRGIERKVNATRSGVQ